MKFKSIILCMTICAMIASCMLELPNAVSYETVNQHHIASKNIEPVDGYRRYQEFTQNNK